MVPIEWTCRWCLRQHQSFVCEECRESGATLGCADYAAQNGSVQMAWAELIEMNLCPGCGGAQ